MLVRSWMASGGWRVDEAGAVMCGDTVASVSVMSMCATVMLGVLQPLSYVMNSAWCCVSECGSARSALHRAHAALP